MKAHSKWNMVAGSYLQDGTEVMVPGFNVLVECEKKADRANVRKLFWTPELNLADGEFDVITIAAHSRSVRVDDVGDADPVLLVAGLLGAENTVIPSAWDEKAAKVDDVNFLKAQKKLDREAKKAQTAEKRAAYRDGVDARKAARAVKKLLGAVVKTQAASVNEVPAVEPEAAVEQTVTEEAPVAE